MTKSGCNVSPYKCTYATRSITNQLPWASLTWHWSMHMYCMWNLAQRYLFIQKQYYYLRYRKRRKRSHMRNGGVFLLHSWWKWAMKSWMTPMNMEDPNTPNRMKSLSIILRSRNIILSQHLKCAILGGFGSS